MREITKREQVVTYIKKNSIDLLCLQETKIPSSSIEQRVIYIYIYLFIYLYLYICVLNIGDRWNRPPWSGFLL